MESIRKQFSLDWLPGSEDVDKKDSSGATKSSLDEARNFLYLSAVGIQLQKAQDHTMPLHDLARAIKPQIRDFNFEDLWNVIRRLTQRGIIRVENVQDPAGNYTIKLTGQP